MKKYLIAVAVIVVIYLLGDYLYFYKGVYIDIRKNEPITSFVKTEDKKILMNKNGVWEEFEIKGVDMGSGEPGQWSTDFDIDEDTYYRWFGQIQEMGANTVRVYTVHSSDFYNA